MTVDPRQSGNVLRDRVRMFHGHGPWTVLRSASVLASATEDIERVETFELLQAERLLDARGLVN